MSDDRLLNLQRMARRLAVTAQWLRGEVRGGRVPCLPAGSQTLFSPEAVEIALAERAAEGNGGPESCE